MAAPVAPTRPLREGGVIHWHGKDVDAVTVAGQLLELRQHAADDEGFPLARASVMNLLVYAGDKSQVDLAIKTVEALALRHPSRAIVVATRPGKSFTLDADVAIHRHPLASHGLIYERAILRAVGADPDDLDTLVIPLLIPHLQSFLWWLGKPDPLAPALRSLASICDRLILDSSSGSAEQLREVSEHLAGVGLSNSPLGRLVIGDMTWTRLDGLREALTHAFDEGRRAEYLQGLRRVDIIGYRGLAHPVSSGELLMAGWLASRLGCTSPTWTPEGVSLRLEGSGHRVLFSFAGIRGHRPPTGLVRPPVESVRISTEFRGRKLQVALKWGDGEGRLSVHETGQPIIRRTVPVPQPDEIEVVSRELARLGRDDIFEESLASAARIQAALTS
jgi:glucose-6-phosphate dehydrogenase assembly protein OpcA